MSNLTLPKYCVLNYASRKGPDDKNAYEFWYCHNFIRIISNNGKPFSRGDVAEIINVHDDQKDSYILVDVLGDPFTDTLPKEVYQEKEIPTLLFLRSRIFLNCYSEYAFQHSDNIEILNYYSTIIDNNKSYVVTILVTGDYGFVKGIDVTSKTEFEWICTDQDSIRY